MCRKIKVIIPVCVNRCIYIKKILEEHTVNIPLSGMMYDVESPVGPRGGEKLRFLTFLLYSPLNNLNLNFFF